VTSLGLLGPIETDVRVPFVAGVFWD
jgi:hypothetical protein